jgi:hypothetical protein
MKKTNYFIKLINKFTTFDYLLLILLIFVAIFFAFILFRKQSYITVVVKVSDENINWSSPGTKDWFSSLFYNGMTEKDGLGRKEAEVIKVFSYNSMPDRKDVYLTVKLKAVFTKALDQYSYKGRPVLVGYPIMLQLDNINTEGVITNIGDNTTGKKVQLILEVTTWDDKRGSFDISNFTETTGIRPYIAEAILKDYVIADNKGNNIVKVLDKKVTDSIKLVTTSDGRVLIQKNPLLKDLNLTLAVQATEINGKYFLFDDIPILIGQKIPLNFNNVSIFPEVTKFTLDE